MPLREAMGLRSSAQVILLLLLAAIKQKLAGERLSREDTACLLRLLHRALPFPKEFATVGIDRKRQMRWRPVQGDVRIST